MVQCKFLTKKDGKLSKFWSLEIGTSASVCVCMYIYIYIYIYIYTLPFEQDVTQGQFFKQNITGLNSEFSFS